MEQPVMPCSCMWQDGALQLDAAAGSLSPIHHSPAEPEPLREPTAGPSAEQAQDEERQAAKRQQLLEAYRAAICAVNAPVLPQAAHPGPSTLQQPDEAPHALPARQQPRPANVRGGYPERPALADDLGAPVCCLIALLAMDVAVPAHATR